jgi:hypothetical protein
MALCVAKVESFWGWSDVVTELGGLCKKAIVVSFVVLSKQYSGWNKENHKILSMKEDVRSRIN